MSLPPASQCCRVVVHRRLRSQHDNLWIPDSLLAAAFERFCAISRTSARYGSSVPGPLENRKRMGRRHMGELNFGHAHSPPALWELESLVDLSRWKWQPPSSPDTRQRYHKAENVKPRSLRDIILDWVGVPTIDATAQVHKQEPQNHGGVAFTPDMHLDEAAAVAHVTDVSTVKERPPILWGAQNTLLEVVDTALISLFQDLSLNKVPGTLTNFVNFCNSWKQSLTDHRFSDEVVCFILTDIKRALTTAHRQDDALLTLEIVNRAKLGLLEATIQGLSSRVSCEPAHFDHLTMSYLLHEISELPMNNIRIFTKSMALIPDCHVKDMAEGILANLCAYLTALGRGGKLSTLIRQANKMARPSKKLSSAENRSILYDATQHLLMHKLSEDLDYPRMRLGWLQLLARLPGVSEDYLGNTCFLLEAGREVEPLSNRDLSGIYLAFVKRVSPINRVTALQNALQETRNKDDSECYSNLSAAFWKTGQYDHIKGLCKFLGHLGREQDIIRLVKGLRKFVQTEVSPLVSLSVGMKEPMLALEILSLYAESRKSGLKFWNSTFGADALSTLTKSPSLRHRKLMSALGVCAKDLGRYQPKARPKRGRLSTSVSKRQVWKTARVAKALSRSPNLSRRTAFTMISHCIRYLRSRNEAIPAEVLQALLHNITRDLAEGRPGRSTRLRWFLELLLKRAGPEEMSRTGLALQRWRERNYPSDR
ncbi:hypothetical protein F4779DRAFT_398834 [Xylariaceae sp. FL0662B]|nr:hypothetical protein F4779DRAFT_398834 [Xylariaceae sp. FL0662B]